MQGNGYEASANKVFKQMSLMRHLAIHEVNESNNKSGEEDEWETMDAGLGVTYEEDTEENKVSQTRQQLLIFDDKKSYSEEDITEIENQTGNQRDLRTQSDPESSSSSG